ncbi:Oidioi.mRNA.OKI2018_I69.chr2.g5935.t1.cds [Oikopleura dioica]|uniref:Oidioi.mRNA.OKI2018_I69.chr2.g5935.t1.cds n=1 Tax=Oikopleura dioica TaxID=34765 RepID=A0ABN7T6A5_OIKDI|nr:Oidioi.mRNA.OKI2018_I69.chr2.g5935.t1.cds [Oikopleura dioica]
MPKKDESSGDEFVPSGEEENSAPENQGSDEEEEAEQEDDFDPYQPRKAKLNRKNIVESEDSDKLSTDPDNSDEYDPDEKKSKMKRSAKHADSDSDDQPKFTPSPKKKKIVQRRRRPPRRRPVSESDTEDSASTATESESDEAEASDKSPAAPTGNTVVDQLQAKFPDVPRSDITRVYYQSSCQMDKAIAYLTNEYSPSKFSKPKVENGSRRVPANGPDLSEESEESEDENEKTNLQSEEDQESEDEKPVVKNKRKALNSSDEEWCPAAKKQKTKSSKKKPSVNSPALTTMRDQQPVATNLTCPMVVSMTITPKTKSRLKDQRRRKSRC